MKILYVTTISNTVNAFLIPHIKMLIGQGHQVDVAFNIEQEVKREINEMGCKIHQIPLLRSPLRRDNIRAYRMLKNIIISEGYDLVHTHTPVASAVVRLACRKLSSVKVFYTAHGFHFYRGAPIRNWLVYYPVEKWLARYTDVLITINKEDYERAKSRFKSKNVKYVPGVGIDVEKYRNLITDKTLKRNEIGVPEDSIVLLSVGELNENKNHEVVIRALSEIKDNNIHYIVCGQGHLEGRLRSLITENNLDSNIHFLGYRNDIAEICKVSDLFVFPSFREGLSVALMEAMACGMPVICSNIRGNSDLISDSQGGYLFDPYNNRELSVKIRELIIRYDLRSQFGLFNQKLINRYSFINVFNSLKLIYKDELDE